MGAVLSEMGGNSRGWGGAGGKKYFVMSGGWTPAFATWQLESVIREQ